jgi:beta-glucanase (GH16 family)
MYGRLGHARADSRPAGRSRRARRRRWPAAALAAPLIALAAPLIALAAPAAATAVPASTPQGTLGVAPASAAPASAAAPGAASVAAAVRATASRADAAAGRVPAPPPGWTTEFADSFNGPARSKPSASKWHYDVGPGSSFGTGEIETMTDSTRNGYLNGQGRLHLTAREKGGSWTSARIQTNTANVGAPRGGKLEVTASIRQPSPARGLGYWPAFWMLGPGQWPENGEIDIMEDVNALSELSGTIHCGTYPGGRCNEPDGIGSGLQPCPGCQDGYHTYTMILNRATAARQSITFYLDGQEYFRVRERQVGASTWRAAFDHKLSIIFDLAMGGGYPDGVCGCTTPTSATSSGGTMSVAYVAAYRRAG